MAKNHCVVLDSRPGEDNVPTVDNFCLKEYPVPDIEDGQILVKTLCLSVDPYMRSRFNQHTGTDYMSPWKLDCPIDGGGVGAVVESKSRHFCKGEIVESIHWPWQEYAMFEVEGFNSLILNKVESELVKSHVSLMLGVLGVPGLTALLGISEKGHVTEGANQTFVVSAAAGACGSLAGQIARVEGCTNVVGICGTEEKCKFLTDDLKFDAAINYKDDDVDSKLKEYCPGGIDIYFDNVGGQISNSVIKQMNKDSHIILCGQISMYNTSQPYPPPLEEDIENIRQERNITRDRFLVLNYYDQFPKALAQLKKWYEEGKLKYRETISEGLEKAPEAFVSMMSGGNIGKQIVHVSGP
ncbi:Prostaglandin reductase 2 [Holothuria leucospilota]|uniref:15-oxoprostaglandin 13-reductase n=1 Tax=Holothuria leucospilota TaxID=206669 RepID=A0A9Q1BKF8_HOLLE|nr:Prostaglandin reductase 2 [Holothuria leucospilota]